MAGKLKGLGTGASLTPPKKYREKGMTSRGDYADPKRYKYPVGTEENARAALSYFSKPKNHGEYSGPEKKAIARRIVRAARKFKIAISPDSTVLRLAGEKGSK